MVFTEFIDLISKIYYLDQLINIWYKDYYMYCIG